MTEKNAGEVAAEVVNRWSWWRNALAGNFGPIHEGDPQQGYYRVRYKDKATGKMTPWEPVAIWMDEDGNWLAYRGGKEVRADEIWTWACRSPVTYEAYEKARAGEGWDDDAVVVTAGETAGLTDHERLKAELERSVASSEEFLAAKVETKAQADKAASWAKSLAELAKEAEDLRKVEKQPHLDAGRKIDAKWKEITDLASDLTKKLKKHVEPYLIAQKREEEARARKAAEEAEAKRQEAMRLNDEDSRAAALKEADQAEADAKVQNSSAGRTGTKVSLRVEKTGKVTDYAKAAQALVEMKHSDMIALIDQLANRAARSGMPFAGMTVVEVEKAV